MGTSKPHAFTAAYAGNAPNNARPASCTRAAASSAAQETYRPSCREDRKPPGTLKSAPPSSKAPEMYVGAAWSLRAAQQVPAVNVAKAQAA
jgi:hypothetical protein